MPSSHGGSHRFESYSAHHTDFLGVPPRNLLRNKGSASGPEYRPYRQWTMARPKKTSSKSKTHTKGSSTRPKRTAVVWIAPDLERITKGERGRRGLADPTSGYYLRLADLALTGTSGASPKAAQTMHLTGDEALLSTPFPAEPEIHEQQSIKSKRSKISAPKPPKLPAPPKRPTFERPHQSSPEHPKLALPRLQPPKPGKFRPPKPPKSPKKPKPPRHSG